MILVEGKILVTIGSEKMEISRTDALSLYNALKRELGIVDSVLSYPTGIRTLPNPFQFGQHTQHDPQWEKGTVTC